MDLPAVQPVARHFESFCFHRYARWPGCRNSNWFHVEKLKLGAQLTWFQTLSTRLRVPVQLWLCADQLIVSDKAIGAEDSLDTFSELFQTRKNLCLDLVFLPLHSSEKPKRRFFVGRDFALDSGGSLVTQERRKCHVQRLHRLSTLSFKTTMHFSTGRHLVSHQLAS